MNDAPTLWTLDKLAHWCQRGIATRRISDGALLPARPHGYYNLHHRLRCAWLVFTGKADALLWTEPTVESVVRSESYDAENARLRSALARCADVTMGENDATRMAAAVRAAVTIALAGWKGAP